MSKTPSYRQRKGYSQAIVTLTDSVTKKRRDFWLGEFGTSASRECYHRLIAEWEALGRRLPTQKPILSSSPSDETDTPTITVIIAAYWKWAKSYYQPNESGTLRVVLRLLRQHYGTEAASNFGPKKLRALREAMIVGDVNGDPPRQPWSRGYINQQVQRIRRLFRWAASHEMISAEVYQTLDTIEPLKRGRTKAREGRKIKPVPIEQLDAVRPYLNRQIRALVELQLLTGARPGELLRMRPIDIERYNATNVWLYRPKEHKNRFRGTERIIYLGPKAQEVIVPFIEGREEMAYLFSPAEAEAERRAELHNSRKTPLSCGNRPGTNRRKNPRRPIGQCYTTASYYVGICRACDRAFPPPPPLAKRDNETKVQWQNRLTAKQKEDLKSWQKAHRWHPHQLRHNAATEIRKTFGLEAAQLVLGHASAQVTDAVYAERDHSKVINVMQRVG